MTPLLEVDGVSKHFGGLYALNELILHVDERRDRLRDRAQRRGQEHGVQRDHRAVLARRRRRSVPGRVDGRASYRVRSRKLGIARTFQNVKLFPNMTVLENAMVGQHCRSHAGVFGAVFRTPTTKAEEERIRERARRGLGVLRDAALRLPPGSAGQRLVVREPPSPRDGARDGHGARRCCCWTSRPRA